MRPRTKELVQNKLPYLSIATPGRYFSPVSKPATPATGRIGAIWYGMGLCVAIAVAGCGGGPRPVPVSGKVLIGGAPMKGGTIRVVPKEGRPAVGQIDADGNFALTTLDDGDGCYPGTHPVEIFVPRYSVDLLSAEERKKVEAQSTSIAEKYNDFRTSGLTVTIDQPTTNLTIELESGA